MANWRTWFPNPILKVTKTPGQDEAAFRYYGEGKKLVYQLKNLMSFNDIKSSKLVRYFTDGAVITAKSLYGADSLDIDTRGVIEPFGGKVEPIEYARFMATYDFSENKIFFRNDYEKIWFYISLDGIINNQDIDRTITTLWSVPGDEEYGTWGVGTTLEGFSLLECNGLYGGFIIRRNTREPVSQKSTSAPFKPDAKHSMKALQKSEYYVYLFKVLGPKRNGTDYTWTYNNVVWKPYEANWGATTFSEQRTYQEYAFKYSVRKLPEMDCQALYPEDQSYMVYSGGTPLNYGPTLQEGFTYLLKYYFKWGTKPEFSGFKLYSSIGSEIKKLSQLRFVISKAWSDAIPPGNTVQKVSWFDSAYFYLKSPTSGAWKNVKIAEDLVLNSTISTFFAFSGGSKNVLTDVLSTYPEYYTVGGSPGFLKYAKWYVCDKDGTITYLYDDATVLPRNPTYTYFYAYNAALPFFIGYMPTPTGGARKGGGITFIKDGKYVRDRVQVLCGTPSGDNTTRSCYRINGVWYTETTVPQGESTMPRGSEVHIPQFQINYKNIPWSFDVWYGNFTQLRVFGWYNSPIMDSGSIEYFYGETPGEPVILGYSRPYRCFIMETTGLASPPYYRYSAEKDWSNFYSDFGVTPLRRRSTQ